MRVRNFVEACKEERDALLVLYSSPDSRSSVAAHLEAAQLDPKQRAHVIRALDQVLTDTFYTILTGLAGSASLGGTQQIYRLSDENGRVISPSDEADLESVAHDVFQLER